MSFEEQLAGFQQRCEQALSKAADTCFQPDSKVSQAARYALLGGGKRVRGVLALATCQMLGGDDDAAEAFSAAVEMIHAFSLVHDDLPCMDDDDLRRGKPATHIAFGQANALLAGDLLALQAFEVAAGPNIPAHMAANAARLLAAAAGAKGMIYGQELDLAFEEEAATEADLDRIQHNKTGALMRAAVGLGALAANRDPAAENALTSYADNLGRCFQVVDDILDETADEGQLGKPIGSDRTQHKTTYVSLFGIPRAKEAAWQLTQNAVAALEQAYGQNAEFLCSFARRLAERMW